MKISYTLIACCIVLLLMACNRTEMGDVIDFPQQEGENYYTAEEVEYFGNFTFNLDSTSSEQAELGRLLFYDTRLSKNNLISCASCHKQQFAFTDGKRTSPGFQGELTLRNAMSLSNIAFQPSVFWDVSGKGLPNDVLRPITNHIEMGMASLDELVAKIGDEPIYKERFRKVFGNVSISEGMIGSALSQFIGALFSYRAKYDDGLKDNFQSFTASEMQGKDLFFGKALCSRCHSVPFFAGDRGVAVNIGLDLEYEDQGNGNGKFKVPSLRNIAVTSPYMHDGRFETLDEVVGHYNQNIQNHPHLSSQLKDPTISNQPIRLQLTDLEKQDLILFLETLTDYKFMNDVRFSNPF